MSDLIAVAAIVLGFGVTVVMFRIQRELQVQKDAFDAHIDQPTWIAYSDYLILASIFSSLFLVLLPLLLFPSLEHVATLARAGCVAAIILEAGYIPSISRTTVSASAKAERAVAPIRNRSNVYSFGRLQSLRLAASSLCSSVTFCASRSFRPTHISATTHPARRLYTPVRPMITSLLSPR